MHNSYSSINYLYVEVLYSKFQKKIRRLHQILGVILDISEKLMLL